MLKSGITNVDKNRFFKYEISNVDDCGFKCGTSNTYMWDFKCEITNSNDSLGNIIHLKA